MKSRREVCYVKDAGFIELEGLAGSIKTGCPATPSYKSRFCENHGNILSVNDDTDEDLGEVPGEPVAESILAKVTRKQTYYQV